MPCNQKTMPMLELNNSSVKVVINAMLCSSRVHIPRALSQLSKPHVSSRTADPYDKCASTQQSELKRFSKDSRAYASDLSFSDSSVWKLLKNLSRHSKVFIPGMAPKGQSSRTAFPP